MDDLISREAALDAIFGCFNVIESKGIDMTVARTIVKGVLDEAPTIDAIPVEWLKQQRECNDPESVKDINGAFVSICIDGVLVLWQKEQEAR